MTCPLQTPFVTRLSIDDCLFTGTPAGNFSLGEVIQRHKARRIVQDVTSEERPSRKVELAEIAFRRLERTITFPREKRRQHPLT